MRVTSQEHLVSTKDSSTPSKEIVSMIDSICDSSTNILDNVGFCVCDLAESAANRVEQITLIRLEHLLREVG